MTCFERILPSKNMQTYSIFVLTMNWICVEITNMKIALFRFAKNREEFSQIQLARMVVAPGCLSLIRPERFASYFPVSSAQNAEDTGHPVLMLLGRINRRSVIRRGGALRPVSGSMAINYRETCSDTLHAESVKSNRESRSAVSLHRSQVNP
jgi:hypothetical protein